MKIMRRTELYLTLGALWLATLLPAAELSQPPVPDPSAAKAAAMHHLSPVEFFRGLLGMTLAEREKALAKRSPADRSLILAKLQEYEALPRAVREARLCQTELHWELTSLMKLSPAEQSNRVNEVSAPYRPMVADLLHQWNAVPAETQKALLEKESFIGTYLRLRGGSAADQAQILDKLPAARRSGWADEMNRWQALPEQQRADLCAQFQHFFSLSDQQRKATMDTLPGAERTEVEHSMQTFEGLPRDQRAQCISSFRKFAVMGASERAQFLNNAARWEGMTDHERQLWRDLVHRLPPAPPAPPGFYSGLPPQPPGFREGSASMPPLPPNVTTPVVIARIPQ